MNTFTIDELQLSQVSVATTAQGRARSHGVFINHSGADVLVLPTRALRSKPNTLFLAAHEVDGTAIRVELPLDWRHGKSGVACGQLSAVALPPRVALQTHPLKMLAGGAIEDDDNLVLPFHATRLNTLECAEVLGPNSRNFSTLPVFHAVPGKDQYATVVGVAVGPTSIVPLSDVLCLVHLAAEQGRRAAK